MRTTWWRRAVLAAAFGLPACGGGGPEEGANDFTCPRVPLGVRVTPWIGPSPHEGRVRPDR